MIDISIIIPTYNRMWSLPRAIASCRNTTCKVEIIVIDDGSTDGTWEWLQNQKKVVSKTQLNLGKSWAVNNGFKISKGKYIKFLDSDDLINGNTLDEQFLLAEKESTDVVVSGYLLIDNQENTLSKQQWVNCDDFIAQQLGECDSSHYSSYLFKKSFIEDIPHRPEFAFRDDRLFVLEVALKKPKISIHDGYALSHRTHDNDRLQFTSKKRIQNNQHHQLYKRIFALLISCKELNQRRINAGIKILWPLAHWIAKYDLQEANEVVQWIYTLNPNFTIPEKGILGWMYNNFGFIKTEFILKIRRKIILNG